MGIVHLFHLNFASNCIKFIQICHSNIGYSMTLKIMRFLLNLSNEKILNPGIRLIIFTKWILLSKIHNLFGCQIIHNAKELNKMSVPKDCQSKTDVVFLRVHILARTWPFTPLCQRFCAESQKRYVLPNHQF